MNAQQVSELSRAIGTIDNTLDFLSHLRKNFSYWNLSFELDDSLERIVHVRLTPPPEDAPSYQLAINTLTLRGPQTKFLNRIYLSLKDLQSSGERLSQVRPKLRRILRSRFYWDQAYTLYKRCKGARPQIDKSPAISNLSFFSALLSASYGTVSAGLIYLLPETFASTPFVGTMAASWGVCAWTARRMARISQQPTYLADLDYEDAVKLLRAFPDIPEDAKLVARSKVGKSSALLPPPAAAPSTEKPPFNIPEKPDSSALAFNPDWIALTPIDLSQERTVRELSSGINNAAYWLQERLSNLRAEQTKLYEEALRSHFQEMVHAETEAAQQASLKRFTGTVANFLRSSEVWLNEIEELRRFAEGTLSYVLKTLERVEDLLPQAEQMAVQSLLDELKHKKFYVSGWVERLNAYLLGLEHREQELKALRRTFELYVPLLTDCQAGSCGVDTAQARAAVVTGLKGLLGK